MPGLEPCERAFGDVRLELDRAVLDDAEQRFAGRGGDGADAGRSGG